MPAPGVERISSVPPSALGALLHRGQPEPARADPGVVGLEAAAVVLDLEHEPRRRRRAARPSIALALARA